MLFKLFNLPKHKQLPINYIMNPTTSTPITSTTQSTPPKCTVECSFGEVIDKISILTIKLNKVTDSFKKINIQKEYDVLVSTADKYKEPQIKQDPEKNTELIHLFKNLINVNTILWNLEDVIREKSKNREYDDVFIKTAEQIHIRNDERYSYKNKINILFNSNIREEKLYNENTKTTQLPIETLPLTESMQTNPSPPSPPPPKSKSRFNLYKKNTLEINVINLSYRKEKMEDIEKNFKETNINLLRFPAIVGQKLPKLSHSPLKPGEIGCYKSHKALWEKCVKEKRPYIIIAEDDIQKQKIFSYKIIKTAIKNLINKPEPFKWDILFLSEVIDRGHRRRNIGFKYNLPSLEDKYTKDGELIQQEPNNLSTSPPTSTPTLIPNITTIEPRCGLHFYVLSYRGCLKCIEAANKINYTAPIDVAIWYGDRTLRSFTIVSGLVTEKPDISDTFSDSLIYEANNHLKNVFTPHNLKASSLSNSYTSANTLSQSTSSKRKIKTADRKTIYKLSDIILKKLNKSPHQNQSPRPRQTPHLHRTTQIDNNSPEAIFSLREKSQEVIQTLEKIIIKNPNWHIPYFLLAMYYKFLANSPNTQSTTLSTFSNKNKIAYIKNANVNFLKAKELTQTDYSVYIEHARFLAINTTDKRHILINWFDCLEINNKDPEPYMNIIHLIMQDNFITTIEYSHFSTFLTNSIKYIPDNKYLLCSVASFFEKKEDLKKACPLFLKALELDPENPKILYNVGLMAAKSENLQSDCEKYFLKSLEIDPNQPYVYTNLLTYYNKTKVSKFKEGIEIAKKAWKTTHAFDFLFELGKLYNKNAEFDNAEETLLIIVNELRNYKQSLSYSSSSSSSPSSSPSSPQTTKLMKLLGDSYKELATTYKWKENYIQADYYYKKLIHNLQTYYTSFKDTNSPKQTYGQYLLLHNKYREGFPYYMWGHFYYNLKICNIKKLIPENSCFFKETDHISQHPHPHQSHHTLQPTTPKTIVLYNSGGFGDAIMYNRFIAPLADKYHNHRIICLIDKKLFWLFNSSDFACKENVVLISEENLKTLTEETLQSKYNVTHIDYQCDIMMLAYFMNLSYNDIPATFNTYLFKNKSYQYEQTKYYHAIIEPLIKNQNYNTTNTTDTNTHLRIAFNWHGNRDNGMDKWQRGVDLSLFSKLFSLPNTTWINVQKQKTPEENKILKSFHNKNVIDTTDSLDESKENAFADTISIFNNVDLVISTDTSLLHLAATMGVKTWALITKVPEYRWGLKKTTAWYEHIRIFRQKQLLDWNPVIDELMQELTNLQIN